MKNDHEIYAWTQKECVGTKSEDLRCNADLMTCTVVKDKERVFYMHAKKKAMGAWDHC